MVRDVVPVVTGSTYLTVAKAAELVGKSERQIRRYIEQGLLAPAHPGVKRYREADVLEAERTARGRVGRPRKERDTPS